MTRFAAADLATVHLLLSLLALAWNIYMAGRIARMPGMPYALAAMSAIAGLVVLPALFVIVASTSLAAGRGLYTLAWIWPATAALMTLQSGYALVRGGAAVPLTAPILLYNATLTAVYVTRHVVQGGTPAPDPLLMLSAAQMSALALSAHPLALLQPLYLHVPLLAPATAGRRGVGTLARSAATALAALWLGVILLMLPEGARAIVSYRSVGTERLQERPDGEFRIGLKILPTLSRPPQAGWLHDDIAMIDTTGANVISIYIAPEGVTLSSLDDLATGLEARRSGRTLVLALDLSNAPRLRAPAAQDSFLRARVADLDRATRILRPDYVVPVLDPLGVPSLRMRGITSEQWQRYLIDARAAVRRVRPATRVLAHVGGYTAADSAMYAWASAPETALDAVGLSLFPGYLGGSRLDARMSTAARWMRLSQGNREHWVLEAGAFPVVHGEASQARALWGALAWSSSQPLVRGFVVYQSSDYGSLTGLRTAAGRIRPAALRVAEAVRQFEEAAVPEAAP